MTDHIDRAAEVLTQAWKDRVTQGISDEPRGHCHAFADALADNGLLVTPEHDAAVAARALRALADETSERHASSLFTGGVDRPYGWGEVSTLLREEADRIEREAGESDE